MRKKRNKSKHACWKQKQHCKTFYSIFAWSANQADALKADGQIASICSALAKKNWWMNKWMNTWLYKQIESYAIVDSYQLDEIFIYSVSRITKCCIWFANLFQQLSSNFVRGTPYFYCAKFECTKLRGFSFTIRYVRVHV